MAFPTFKELTNLNSISITEEIVILKKQIFELRLKKATRQSFKPHIFKHSKRKIAQLLTLESQRKQTIK
jgi:large subunit ribosomal protein L29